MVTVLGVIALTRIYTGKELVKSIIIVSRVTIYDLSMHKKN